MNTELKKKNKSSEEAFAYTPGLKVKVATTISKTRRLPIAGEIFVKVGDQVNYNTIVAKTQVSGDPEVVNVAGLLGVEPEDIPGFMTKKSGDQIAKGEVIAAYSTLFGLMKKQVTSPLDGTLENISDITGQAIVRSHPVPVFVNAYIPGKIIEVVPRQGVVIETNAAFIQGIFGVGGETHGEIRIAVDAFNEELTVNKITSEYKGTVLVGGSSVSLEALRKAVEVGVSCVVTGGIKPKALTTLIGGQVGVAITGQEEVGLTLIITEGFGKMTMSRRTFDLLKGFEGYTACVNGATQIRAGVLRPEIIVPHKESFKQTSSDELAAGMIPGTPVRIIRQPYFGLIGKVKNLPAELHEIQTKSYVRIVQVELEDGTVVIVPRANVEIIEE